MKKLLSITLMSLILLCGGLFAGCGDETAGLLLTFSEQKIEMVTTTEKVDYVIFVQNVGERQIDFNFEFETQIARVIDNEATKIGDGQYSISIAPISAGRTTLKITIRGTKCNIEIPVAISEELQSFKANENLHVVRGGNSIAINSSCFIFTPSDTIQKNLSFTLKEGQNLEGVTFENGELFVSKDCTASEILFVAKSEDVLNLTEEFSVKVVSDVSLNSLKISCYSQSIENKEEFDANSISVLFENGKNVTIGEGDNQTNKPIEIVVNDQFNFQKMISVEYAFAGENADYAIDVSASDGVAGDLAGVGIIGKTQGFNFVVQSVKITSIDQPHIIKFKIYQKDFEVMFKEVVIKVYVTSEPKEIRVDGYTELPLVEIYHNSGVPRNFRFAVYPDITNAYNQGDYHYSISFYTSEDGVTPNQQIAYKSTSGVSLSDYMVVKYAGEEIDKLSYSIEEIDKLSSLLQITPIKEYSGYFIIRIKCLDKNNNVVGSIINQDGTSVGGCYNDIKIKIHRGTENFAFGEGYENGIIYLEMGKTERFNAFLYDEGSTIGELIISLKTITPLACTISQDLTSIEPMLVITPILVGESEFILQTQNGKFLTLKVIVIREIDQSDFAIKIADVNSNAVSWFSNKTGEEYKYQTIDAIIIKGASGSVTIKDQIDAYSDTNANSYMYSLSLYATDDKIDPNKYFTIDKNTITATNFTFNNGVDIEIYVKVDLVVFDAVAFKHAEKEFQEKLNFDFRISAVDYVKSMNVRATSSESTEKTKVVSVYDKNVLSYINQNLSEVYLYLDLHKSLGLVNNLSGMTASWNFSGLSLDETTNTLGSIGYFYKTQYHEETGLPISWETGEVDETITYIGKFVCDINGINIIPSFNITLTIVDDTGHRFESTVTIVIDEYVDVDNIYLTTPLDHVYLDSTEENKSVTVNVYLMPTDAMCKDIQVVIETNTSNCISYTQNGGTITFSFVSGGSGVIRIFPVSKMKTNSSTDIFGNYYYHIALPFNCADGALAEQALKISSYQSLSNIVSGKHYYLDTIIDCSGKEVYIPEFTNGSIRGTFYANLGENGSELYNEYYKQDMQLGGVTNFAIKNNGAYSGLFGKIGAGAYIYNLSISGKFYYNSYDGAWEVEQDAKIGVLAGQNEGKIENVQVSLYNVSTLKLKNTSVRQSINIYLGIVCGQNDGEILTTNNAKISTFMTYMPEKENIFVEFETNSKTDETTNVSTIYTIVSYVGGVAGRNGAKGKIVSLKEDEIVLGHFGINVYANITVQNNSSQLGSNFVGGVVGENKGQVKAIRAIGQIYANDTVSAVGGVVGLYSYTNDTAQNFEGEIENNISRVFVRGKNVVCGLVGSIFKPNATTFVDTSKILNNKVQATDDGTRVGVEASLILKYGAVNNADISTYSVYKIAETALDASNIAESYFDRTLLSKIDPTGDKANYYGELVCKEISADTFVGAVMEKGQQEVVEAKFNSIVLAIYKKAAETANQSNINNQLKTINLLNFAEISAKEVYLESNKLNLISLSNFGETIKFNGTGVVRFTITSSLNYKNSCEIEICLTNFYNSIKEYQDKDHIEELERINLVNTNAKKVYLSAYANVYNYKNTPIALVNNTDITFECVAENGQISGNPIVDVNVSGQEIYLKALLAQKDKTTLKYNPIYNFNDAIYYATYANNLGAFVFLTNQDLQKLDLINKKESASINVDVVTGIENIVIGKANSKAEPTDNIILDIKYNSYNPDDYLVPTLTVDGITYLYQDGFFKGRIANQSVDMFKATLETAEQIGENEYKQVCHFQMVENGDVYDLFKDKTLYLTFVSYITGQSQGVTITYSPETITSVLINNYSKEENDDQMIKKDKYTLSYDEDLAINSSKFTSSGDYNMLKVYVYTKLAEFDYVDISMNVGSEGGYLALGEIVEDQNGEKVGKISNNSVYTSIGGVVTLRVYRSDIFKTDVIFDETQHVLPITIIYSAPAVLSDGTKVPIAIDFFKVIDGIETVCYQTGTTVITKNEKRVEFTINDKETSVLTDTEETVIGANQAYRVVRGAKYFLNLEVVGFEEDEIIIESSAPNIANVQCVDGLYMLNITDASLDFTSEYITVVISSYGEKTENNKQSKSRVQKTVLRIYEFLLDEENLFNGDTLDLRLLTSVDVREQIVSKLTLEYAIYSNKVKEFEDSLKNSANSYISWMFESNGISISLPTTQKIATAEYELLGYNLKPLKTAEVAPYSIILNYAITYKNGMPTCALENQDKLILGSQKFNVSVYLNTNEDLPAPIYNYNDFISMKSGEHYRLVSDIEIRGGEYQMLTQTPASLDGNGYKITIIGDAFGANTENISNFALFETIAENAIFKNITIVVKGRKTIQIDNTTSAQSVNIAILCATNNGIITNCKIVSEEIIYANVIATVSVMENSSFGTLAAVNNGYITNCQIEANISVGGASVGGLVCINNGKISSSYVKNSRIANTTSSSSVLIVTGGFVCQNLGSISMSFVEGSLSNYRIYSDFTPYQYGLDSKIIYTSTMVGGFVYQNGGNIEDCYANIPIVCVSKCAGFVAVNGGKISRAISLSKMKQRDTLNHAFVTSIIEGSEFNDCFFVIESGVINDYTSESNYKIENGKYLPVINGVTPLGITKFKDQSVFKNFVISENNNKTSGVWFFAKDQKQDTQMGENSLITYTTKVSEFEYFDGETQNTETPTFVAGRLQLVAPNLVSYARQNLNILGSEENAKYAYSIDNPVLALGGKYNPYLIASAQDFEEYAKQKTTAIQYYRLLCDIDYQLDGVYSSNLVDKTLVAYFEGNNFAISNYAVNNKTAYLSGGLFSQFGGSVAQMSTLKNVTFAPSYINLPNSVYVGAIAGSACNAYVNNVKVENKDVVILGKNIVGGLFGRTYNQTYMKNIYSDILVKSSQYSAGIFANKDDVENLYNNIKYKETGANRTSVSYAGAMVGYVTGACVVNNASIGENTKVYGAIAGLMFGGIGSLAQIGNIGLNLGNFSNEVGAYAFGGILSGENRGNVSNITINSDVLNKKLFNCKPIVPVAIGGIAGVMSGGTIDGVYSQSGYSVVGISFTGTYGDMVGGYSTEVINNPYVVKYVGGLVGYAKSIIISNVDICSDAQEENKNNVGLVVSGANYVGGLVGYVKNSIALNNKISVYLTSHKKFVNQDGNEIEEMLYSAYVSEASISQIAGFVFNRTLMFGALIGAVEEDGGIYNADEADINVLLDTLYVYYADYTTPQADIPTSITLHLVGNKNTPVNKQSDDILVWTYKNLAGLFAPVVLKY